MHKQERWKTLTVHCKLGHITVSDGCIWLQQTAMFCSDCILDGVGTVDVAAAAELAMGSFNALLKYFPTNSGSTASLKKVITAAMADAMISRTGKIRRMTMSILENIIKSPKSALHRKI